MKDYTETNRDLWNGWTKIHAKSKFYDLDGFRSGKTSLKPTELEELGDVSGKSLLHLQCHFGLDTLSWARRGARVTGVDFSEEAISFARSLSKELDIEAEFICSDIYDLPEVLDRQFDIVFTSYGVLCWLSDLRTWATIIKRYLRPGGTFYIVTFHPYVAVLDDSGEHIENSYFYSTEPMKYECQGSYAGSYEDPDFTHTAYEWVHGLGDIVTALISAGLKLEFLHEFPFSIQRFQPFFEEIAPGRYALKDRPNTIPLMFSIRATC